MRIHLSPTGLFSRAMVRVANALTKYAPDTISITPTLGAADLHILHVISADSISYAAELKSANKKYAVIQYCTNPCMPRQWEPLWLDAEVVWSYYDLRNMSSQDFNFYHAPLGIDEVFTKDATLSSTLSPSRERLVLTSGYVSGPGSEAIEDVWTAARASGLKAIHIGPPKVKGIASYPDDWSTTQPSDEDLADLYRRAQWVAALRYVEGFELPAAEGLACGARPILFDQDTLRHWYGSHAIYTPECHGEELIDNLRYILSSDPAPVSTWERSIILSKFDWSAIAREFWHRLKVER